MKSFALIGAAGFVAPRHLKAIKAINGDLLAAVDPNDSVGILDSYFPDADFFVDFGRFKDCVKRLEREGRKIDYVTICSPNHLHDTHCDFALRTDADAICEKPLVLDPWKLDDLAKLETKTGRKISTILQLRLHPAISALKDRVSASPNNEFALDLTYVTPRGRWYHESWKGDETKSGGVAMNIGVHFFDMVSYVFGPPRRNVVHLREIERAAGYLECGRAHIRWFLSIAADDLPHPMHDRKRTYRSIKLDGREIEFSDGFADLHTLCYEDVLARGGFNLEDVRPSIDIVSGFRNGSVTLNGGDRHPFVERYL